MLLRLLTILLGLSCVTGNALALPDHEPVMLLQVDNLTGEQFLGILEAGFEIVANDGTRLELVVPSSQATRLSEKGIFYSVLEPDMAATYAARYAPRDVGGFRSFMEIEYFLDSLAEARPDIVTPKFSLGQTGFFGMDIWCAKISDNPSLDEDEPEVLYVSMIHAREPSGMAALINIMQYLADNYGSNAEITELVDSRELYFVPCQNPDGYLWNESGYPGGGGMWRKNLRDNGDGSQGVDCNRNYGYRWGCDNLGSSPYTWSETYRGPWAFSEPETRAIRDFAASHHLSIIHNFHSYADLVIWPWGYDYQYTNREDFFSVLGDSMTLSNGYADYVGWKLYLTNGDADDWGWGDTINKPRIISVTTEIGGSADGFWPDPSNIPGLVAENLLPSLFLARIADNPYRIAPPLPPTMMVPKADADTLVLSWHPTDTANPAVHYRVQELAGRVEVTDSAEDDLGYWNEREMYRATNRVYSGTSSWHNWIRNSEIHYLESSAPTYVGHGDSLRFMIWYDIQDGFDYFYAQVSTDGGLSYVSLPGNLTTNYNPYGQNLGNGITGQSTTWVPAVFDLSPWLGQYVTIRLAYLTDSYSVGEGVYLDEIGPCDTYSSITVVDSLIADTIYRIPGAIPSGSAYRVTATDAQDQKSRWSNVVFGGATFAPGDVNASGTVNVADITYLVAALFRGGPDPVPVTAGDINCSGDLNVADLTALVSALFRGGTLSRCW